YRNYDDEDALQRISAFIFRTHLQSLLAVDDRLSMLHHLEARVPWLDHRIIELGFRVPSYLKIQGNDPNNRAKAINRAALRGVVPDHVIDRQKLTFPDSPPPYAEALRALVREDIGKMARSPFMRQLFKPEFLPTLATNPNVGGRELLA